MEERRETQSANRALTKNGQKRSQGGFDVSYGLVDCDDVWIFGV